MKDRRKVKVDTSRIRPRVEEYGGLQPGDVVKLTGEKGSFRFLAVAVDGGGDVLHVDLHGGTPGREKLRSVSWDRLKIPTTKQLARQRLQRAERAAS